MHKCMHTYTNMHTCMHAYVYTDHTLPLNNSSSGPRYWFKYCKICKCPLSHAACRHCPPSCTYNVWWVNYGVMMTCYGVQHMWTSICEPRICTCYTYIYIQTIHTYAYIHMHTYIHIYMHAYICKGSGQFRFFSSFYTCIHIYIQYIHIIHT
jgi:hypothetical protein